MIRTILLRSVRAVAAPRCMSKISSPLPIARPAVSRFTPTILQSARCYSAAAGLSKAEVESRIVDLLIQFDKVSEPTKVTPESHFAKDLGLDSLDAVEVVMAIEEEFSIEIPDKEADAIQSVRQAVDYILAQPEAH